MDEKVTGFQEFLVEQEKGSDIYDFVVEVYTGQPPKEADDRLVTFSEAEILGMIGVVLAPTIHRVLTFFLDKGRSKLELDDTKARIELIRFVKEAEGISLDEAEKIVTRTWEAAKRPEKARALQAMMDFIRNRRCSTPPS